MNKIIVALCFTLCSPLYAANMTSQDVHDSYGRAVGTEEPEYQKEDSGFVIGGKAGRVIAMAVARAAHAVAHGKGHGHGHGHGVACGHGHGHGHGGGHGGGHGK